MGVREERGLGLLGRGAGAGGILRQALGPARAWRSSEHVADSAHSGAAHSQFHDLAAALLTNRGFGPCGRTASLVGQTWATALWRCRAKATGR